MADLGQGVSNGGLRGNLEAVHARMEQDQMIVNTAFIAMHADYGNGCVHAMGISRFIPHQPQPVRSKVAFLVAELEPEAADVGAMLSIRAVTVNDDGKELFGSTKDVKFVSERPVWFIAPLMIEGLFPGSYLASLIVNGVRLKSAPLEMLGPG